jgi:2'-5' RNA ligase
MRRFTYADTSSWKEWQREYRYGALYIFPPEGIIEPIDELRRRYDPISYATCQAHVSLSEPAPRPLTEADIHEVQTQLATISPFVMHYGPLHSFPPYPGVVYSVTPEDAFTRLRSAIHATSLFASTPFSRKRIAPHMTIAEFITVEQTQDLLEQLSGRVPEGDFLCASIEYALPNDAFSFERVLTLPLGLQCRHEQPR